MLKKAAVVAAAVTSLSLVASPAFAAPAVQAQQPAVAYSSVQDDRQDEPPTGMDVIGHGGALVWAAALVNVQLGVGIVLPSVLIGGPFGCHFVC